MRTVSLYLTAYYCTKGLQSMITGDSLHMLGPKFSELVVCNSFFSLFFWAVYAILYFSRPDLSRKNAVEMSCRMAFQCWLKFFFCKYYLVPLSAKWIIFICSINLLRSSNLLNLFLEIKKIILFSGLVFHRC